ncbi:MAG: biopolymer transporter ExbD [Verrucomicrobiota bacterium]
MSRRNAQTVEMQMGPMIDMVFLLLVFFMVTAKPLKPENDVSLRMPGTVPQEEVFEFPDEQRITIRDNGQVQVNEMNVDSPDSKDLPQLKKTLFRFKEMSDANRADAIVTIDAEDQVSHQRIVDVLNACSDSEITNVSFSFNDETEEF